jgi:VWFA-related protein
VLACAGRVVTAQDQTPVFRSSTNIVTIDVTAVDKDGRPVLGLKPEDFAVTIDGKPRKVQTLDFAGVANRAAAAADAAVAAAPGAPATTERRVVVLLFDDLSIGVMNGRGLSAAAERTLGAFGPDDLVGVTSISGKMPVVNPTTDREPVRAAITKFIGTADVSPTPPFHIAALEAVEIDRDFDRSVFPRVVARECPEHGFEDPMSLPACEAMIHGLSLGYASDLRLRVANQMDAYRQVIDALRPFKGAKVVIALSGGVASFAEPTLTARQLEPIMRAAAESGVRFYAMAEEPDLTSMTMTAPDANRQFVNAERSMFDGLVAVATAAGGEAFHAIGQADRLFRRIEAETSAVYHLGVEAPPNARADRYLDAKVKVGRPGVTVRANRRALSAAATAPVVSTSDRMKAALSAGGTDAEIPVSLATSVRQNPATRAGLQVGVNVDLPASVAGPVTVMFALVNAAGATVSSGQRLLPVVAAGQPHRFAFGLPVDAGTYSLRVAASDAAGHVGSAENRVIAELRPAGRFRASDLLAGYAAPGGDRLLTLEALPPDVPSLHVSLELYAPDAAALATDVAVVFSLAPSDGGPAVLTRESHPLANGLTLTASVDVPVSALPDGAYLLTAVVRQSGSDVAVVRRVLRKVSTSQAEGEGRRQKAEGRNGNFGLRF